MADVGLLLGLGNGRQGAVAVLATARIPIARNCAAEITRYTLLMKSTKYNLWQDDNGAWRGYLEGYPQYEIDGESFQELQGKLWQLHQELTADEVEQEQNQPERQLFERREDPSSPARVPRPMSHAQIKRRARVEQLMFALISNP
ncbi:MAG: hypothetical protein A4E19_16905 [Nitrospira sp. SG-bin1]|nr:MAG: hypothetical protein A4E19_16905 [Nitrospira sp. SG-bin1]